MGEQYRLGHKEKRHYFIRDGSNRSLSMLFRGTPIRSMWLECAEVRENEGFVAGFIVNGRYAPQQLSSSLQRNIS